jgi:hypothetical protein
MQLRWLALLSLLYSTLACRSADDGVHTRVGGLAPAPRAQAPSSAASADDPAAALAAYPRGSWRQRPSAELSDTVLWVSHILIRHQDAEDPRASFSVTDWSVAVPPATRSAVEALTLARQIAAEATRASDFERLARERSEDPVTRERGGSLGGVTAVQFLPWPHVLDALEALRPGEISRPLETEFGYHVLQRRAVPPEQQVSGAHVVIAHDQAPWIEVVGRRVPQRTREASLLLATRIQRQAQASSDAFARLAEEHSDHRDAVRGGDFGTWPTHEPCPFAREIEILSELRVGEISAPIDTPLGYQVLQRTENRSRSEYGMERLLLRFDASVPEGAPGSRSVVRARAEELAAQARDAPQLFDSSRRESCCVEPTRVLEGREPPELEQALARLGLGQIAEQPLEYGGAFYLLPRRIELTRLPPTRTTYFELSRTE